MWFSIVINVNLYQILVHETVIFRNLILVCIAIKDKLIKHLYNSNLRKLPIAYGEVSVMTLDVTNVFVSHTDRLIPKLL